MTTDFFALLADSDPMYSSIFAKLYRVIGITNALRSVCIVRE